MNQNLPERTYVAAGGVVVHNSKVLVLDRPNRAELRLPKGHIDPGEDAETAALREVIEESGYVNLHILADLGTQIIEFDYQGEHVIRTEHYFLMALTDEEKGVGEKQFIPIWLTWEQAVNQLTFEGEREWVRQARKFTP